MFISSCGMSIKSSCVVVATSLRTTSRIVLNRRMRYLSASAKFGSRVAIRAVYSSCGTNMGEPLASSSMLRSGEGTWIAGLVCASVLGLLLADVDALLLPVLSMR